MHEVPLQLVIPTPLLWDRRGTSLIRNSAPLGPHSRTMPRALWCSWGGVLFLMSEVPLQVVIPTPLLWDLLNTADDNGTVQLDFNE